jgi:hypothetical protein
MLVQAGVIDSMNNSFRQHTQVDRQQQAWQHSYQQLDQAFFQLVSPPDHDPQ